MEPTLDTISNNRKKKFILIALIVALLITVIAIILVTINTNKHKTKTPNQAARSYTYTDTSGIYTLQIPTAWSVQADLAAPVDAQDYHAFGPSQVIDTYKKTHKNDFLEISAVTAVNSDAKAKDWFIGLKLGNPAVAQDLTINKYNAYGAKTIGPSGMDDHYVIAHKGKIVHLIFHQRIVLSPKDTIDNSKYLVDFDRMATSINFKN